MSSRSYRERPWSRIAAEEVVREFQRQTGVELKYDHEIILRDLIEDYLIAFSWVEPRNRRPER